MSARAGAVLKSVAEAIGVRVTSWKRTAQLNSQVGGKATSKHLTGEAIDVGLPIEPWQLEVLSKISRAVDETKVGGTGPHWHFQVDHRTEALAEAVDRNTVALLRAAEPA